MSDLPSIQNVREQLKAHWHVEPHLVSASPKSIRLFHVDGHGFARIGFPRGGLTAAQLIELVDTLHTSGCAVPSIIPTSTGELSIPLGEMSLSVEKELSGEECSGGNLDILPQVGRDLGRIHSATYKNVVVPGCIDTLGGWIDETLEKAQSLAAEWDHGDQMHDSVSAVGDECSDLKARFGLTHGDVRSPNILLDNGTLGFVDFNPKYEPLLSDVVKIRNKWLMNGDVRYERPLTIREIAGFLLAYHETRPLSVDEVASFPVVWAVEQSWRLAQDLRSTSMFPAERAARWPISQQIGDLPNAMELGRQILQAASLVEDDPHE